MTNILKRPTFVLRPALAVLLAAGTCLPGVALAEAAAQAPAPATATAPAEKKHYVLTVLTNAVPGKEKEFDDWYTKVHLREVLSIPGFVSAQRFKVVSQPGQTPQWSFFAVYNMETDNPQAVVAELMRRYAANEMTSSAAMSPVWYFGAFEPITPLVAK
jgi:hypothetical protein